MTSKERAKLKSIASNMDTILQIGKNPIGDTFIKQVADALKARELIKIHVLETCELTPAETAEALSEAVGCDLTKEKESNLKRTRKNRFVQKLLPQERNDHKYEKSWNFRRSFRSASYRARAAGSAVL